MMVTDSIPSIPQQTLKSEAKIISEKNDKAQPEDKKLGIAETAKCNLERKSIFTDHRGVLIAQIKDHTGEVIANYPSNEVIKRYHLRKEIQ